MKKCPVCEFTFPNPVPAFCPQCGWDIKNDPTIVPSLDKIPETLLDEYRQRIKIAKINWQKLDTTTAHKKELEQALGDSFRENEELTKSKAKVLQLVEAYKKRELELREKSAGERSKTETAQQEVLQSRQALDELAGRKRKYEQKLEKCLKEEQAKTIKAEHIALQSQQQLDAAQRRVPELEQELSTLHEQNSTRKFIASLRKLILWFGIFGLIPTLLVFFIWNNTSQIVSIICFLASAIVLEVIFLRFEIFNYSKFLLNMPGVMFFVGVPFLAPIGILSDWFFVPRIVSTILMLSIVACVTPCLLLADTKEEKNIFNVEFRFNWFNRLFRNFDITNPK